MAQTPVKLGTFKDLLLDRQIEELVSYARSVAESTAGTAGAPATITALTTSGGFGHVRLQYAYTSYSGHKYTEVWRSNDTTFANADRVGATAAQFYQDFPASPQISDVFYYWVRNVNMDDAEGDLFGPVAGSVGSDPEYNLDMLIGQLGFWHLQPGTLPVRSEPTFPTLPSVLYPVNSRIYLTTNQIVYKNVNEAWVEDLSPEIAFKIIAGQIAAGALVVDDGVMQNGYIKNAHITDCSVSKLIAGIISAGDIYLGEDSLIHLDGANQKITVNDGTYDRVILGKLASGWGIEIYDATGTAILNSGGVNASAVSGLGAFALVDQITSANIATYMSTAAIGEAYLGEASVGTLKIQADAVTVPVHSSYDGAGYLGTDYSELLSGTLDSGGQPIHVLFTCHCNNWADSTYSNTVYLEVLLDGVSQKSGIKVSYVGSNARNAGVAVLLYQIDGVSSGNRVVTIRGKKSTASDYASAEISYKSLLLQGIKR